MVVIALLRNVHDSLREKRKEKGIPTLMSTWKRTCSPYPGHVLPNRRWTLS
jgi:hypothetical protein